jgi:hypothetical protein
MALQLFKIETIEITNITSSITFSNIPQGYTDLKLVGSVRSNVVNPYDFIYFYLNSPGTGAYTQRLVRGDGSSVSSQAIGTSYYPLQMINGNGSTSNTFGSFEVYIPNYKGSAEKSFSVDIVSETNSTGIYADLQAGRWNQTAAITAMTLASGSGPYLPYSTFTLYGVL